MPWVHASVSCGSSVIRVAASVGRNMREAPIGVFDSGVGGLSVLAEIQRLLPNESLLYVADCGNIPYGEKTPQFIQQRCSVMAEFFRQQGAKALVLACNTATVAGVADLRRDYPELPIVGMEPAVKPAAAATRSGVVGVLATTGTLDRKSTRLNSSHSSISYAVFCLKKKIPSGSSRSSISSSVDNPKRSPTAAVVF